MTMQYRELGRTGLKVSALGFGAMRLPMDEVDGEHRVREDEALACLHRAIDLGVTYFDSGWGYCYGQSETTLGKALEGRRDGVVLSTKAPLWIIKETGDFRRFLETQLGRLKTDRLDLYYLHGLSMKGYEEKVRPLGLLEEAAKARDEGLVHHLGFSSHDSPENVQALIDQGWAESILCQYNLLDQKHELTFAYARKRGVGVSVMGPVGGGRLGVASPKLQAMAPGGVKTTAEIALRFVLSNPNVGCALSGMGSVAMVEENAAVASRPDAALAPAELEQVREAMAETRRLADLYCTGCNYCMPCPEGVRIPWNFELLNYDRVYGLGEYARQAYARAGAGTKPEQRADACVACGQCEPKCPQNIAIREQLAQVHETLSRPAEG